jgi:hypothetical protein
MAFQIALTGKQQRSKVRFSAQQQLEVELAANGPLGVDDYSVAGMPIVAERNVVLIAVAAAQTYTVVIKGRSFAFVATGLDTVTTIRDGLDALIGAAAAALGISITDSGVDSSIIQSLTPGVRLAMSVTASVTPANITLTLGMSTLTAIPLGIVAKEPGRFLLRAPAALTMDLDLVVTG